MNDSRATGGYITLMSVIIAAAVGISIAASLLLLGLGASRTAFATQQSYQAQALASACAEEALQLIHDTASTTPYTGTNSLTLGAGGCTYTVTNAGGNARTIQTTGTVGSATRKNNAQVTSVGPIVLSTWQEVADF